MSNGARTTHLPSAPIVDELIGNRQGSTVRITPDNLAALMGQLSVSVWYDTLTELEADLAWPDQTRGAVTNDEDEEIRGIYLKSGPPDEGAWIRRHGLPVAGVTAALLAGKAALSHGHEFADVAGLSKELALSGMSLLGVGGTANAITAQLPLGVSHAELEPGAIVVLTPIADNTALTVTLDLGGGARQVIQRNGLTNWLAGWIKADQPLTLRYEAASGGRWRVISSGTSKFEVFQALDQKAPQNHGHELADVAGLEEALDGKATDAQGALADTALQPGAQIENIFGLETALNNLDAEAQTNAAHRGNTDNPHNVTKAQLGLPDVLNVGPMDMPVSTAQQAAFQALIDTKGESGGFAGLDSSARVPAAQLPIAEQAQAETGTAASLVMSPQRTTQHFNARVGGWLRESGFLSAPDRAGARSSLNLSYADQETAETGTAASLVMSPQRTTQHFNARVGGWLRESGFLSAPDRAGARSSLNLSYASQETAETGTAASLVMSPQRTTQHFNARVGGWVRTSNLLQSTSALAFLTALGGKQAPAIDAADDGVRALAVLADERAQRAELRAHLQHDQINHIVARLAAAEAIIQQLASEVDPKMTSYAIAATVGTTATVIVPSADVEFFAAQNLSTDGARVAFGFGTPPTSVDDAIETIEAGGGIEKKAITGVPIYAISDVAGTPISGAFTVPRGAPNPLWETDFQAIITGMSTAPVYAWEEAYRRLYSALRREGILARTRGLFIPMAHSDSAARQNWAAPGTYMTAVSEPAFVPGVGFDYDGIDDAHNTGLMLNGWTTSADLAAIVWPGSDDQETGRVAMGDGATAIQANRSPTQAALNTGTTNSDVVSIPYLGAMLGFTRTRDDRATVIRPGGQHTTVFRSRIMTLPGRNIYIGANNASAGVGSFYDGVIKAGYFGRSLTDRQILAFEVAMNDYFAAATAAQAGA